MGNLSSPNSIIVKKVIQRSQIFQSTSLFFFHLFKFRHYLNRMSNLVSFKNLSLTLNYFSSILNPQTWSLEQKQDKMPVIFFHSTRESCWKPQKPIQVSRKAHELPWIVIFVHIIYVERRNPNRFNPSIIMLIYLYHLRKNKLMVGRSMI